ncbi:paralemmin-3 [Otolemur garnettii]|uniref:paralemmin-3 n=1 Tax=Otolemur garnettii TaxID=30611 RepID=UPI0006444670|nr:paralemmin-3 [Otolemur garnettii]
MAESSLYRQRLEVIAEKRRLQEEIRAARRELEEEKLRVERLKRKSLRERWLMDREAEGPERPEDPTAKEPQSPENLAQARIQNLEDSLFTLQSQLQLLQSASTGAQHKPSSRPSWRRQGHRPLSQSTVEAGSEGQTDLDKRASLPVGPVGISPECPSEFREEAIGVLPAPKQVPGEQGASPETNGPCPGLSPGLSPTPEQKLSQGSLAGPRRVSEANGGGVVKVVWEGLRVSCEDCDKVATGPELEAKVEEMVLEAIGNRQGVSRPELPAWVKEDRGIVEVVWEGVGGRNSEATAETGGNLETAVQTSSPRLSDRLEEEASRIGESAPRSSPEGDGQGGSRGEEGSFIWVERVTLNEEWEELLVEGLEGPLVTRREVGEEGPLRVRRGGSAETWEVEKRIAEESLGRGKKGSEEKLGARKDGVETSLVVERKGNELFEPESRGDEEKLGTEGEVEEPLGVESNEGERLLRAEKERSEEKIGVKKKIEEPLGGKKEGGEEKLQATEEPLMAEKKGDEEPSGAERKGEEALEAERKGEEPSGSEKKESEEALEVEREKTQGAEEKLSPEEQKESRERTESQAEKVSKAGILFGDNEELRPEEEGLQLQDKQEGSLEEEAVKPQTTVEGQGPSGDATSLLAHTPAPEQPAECQPLLQGQGLSANPSARAVPTYAPARQPEPSVPTEGEEVSGPKQKTCQCCVVM